MLQLTNGSIVEIPNGHYTGGTVSETVSGITVGACTIAPYPYDSAGNVFNNISYWGSYPVYVCTDKTRKAIEILKTLQAEKQIECKSVPKFIELVEKISNLL